MSLPCVAAIFAWYKLQPEIYCSFFHLKVYWANMKRQVCRQPNSFYCPKIRKGREAPHIVFSASLGGKKKKNLQLPSTLTRVKIHARFLALRGSERLQLLPFDSHCKCPYLTINFALRLTINTSRLLQKAWVLLRFEQTHCSLKGHV